MVYLEFKEKLKYINTNNNNNNKGHRSQSKQNLVLRSKPQSVHFTKGDIEEGLNKLSSIKMHITSPSISSSFSKLDNTVLSSNNKKKNNNNNYISSSKSNSSCTNSNITTATINTKRTSATTTTTNTIINTTNTTTITTIRNNRFSNNRLPMIFVFLLALILSCFTTLDAFQLDGSQSSFAQFRKWYVGLNGSLELEFKTEQPNGLVLYTDDGGTYDFFELKLVEGALRLRYNLGGGAQIITVGRDLHDGHWHKVQVSFYFNIHLIS